MSTVGLSSLFPFILRVHGPMTSALTLSASEHAAVRPVFYDVRAAVRAYTMPILRYATRVGLTAAHGRATDSGTSSLPYWELELVPGRRQNGSG